MKKKMKYRFASFFSKKNDGACVIQDEALLSNGHFIIKKSILNKTNLKIKAISGQDIVDQKNQSRMETIYRFFDESKKLVDEYFKPENEFIPDKVVQADNENDMIKAIYSTGLDISVKEAYYNFIIDKGCKLYKTHDSLTPLIIMKNDEYIGVVLPTRLSDQADREDYNEYMENKAS